MSELELFWWISTQNAATPISLFRQIELKNLRLNHFDVDKQFVVLSMYVYAYHFIFYTFVFIPSSFSFCLWNEPQ